MSMLLVILGLSSLIIGSQANAIRGLNPDQADNYYGAGGFFSCSNGSKKIPFSRVNDNYCDCEDGSDEPGTSACGNGRFYCRNKGHEAQMLSASFVDDGICDCCDGTDELKGCPNTCLEKNSYKLVELQEKVASYNSFLTKKASIVDSASAKRKDWNVRSTTIDAEIQAKQSVVDAARAEKAKAEEHNSARVTVERAAREAEEVRRELIRSQKRTEEERKRQELEASNAGAASEQPAPTEEVVETTQEETTEERGRRIASQWTTDPDASASTSEDVDDDEPDDEGQADYEPLPYVQAPAAERLGEWEEFMVFVNLLKQWTKSWGAWFKMVFREGIARDLKERKEAARLNHERKMEYKAGQHRHLQQQQQQGHARQQVKHKADKSADVSAELSAANLKLSGLEVELQSMIKDKSDMESYQTFSYDYGPADIFFPYAGRCFQDNGARWTFEACFFDKASQMEAHSHQNRVNLGVWRGFRGNYSMAVFEGGDPCNDAPARSLRVRLECGMDELMHSGSEPSTCVYDVVLTTPVACNQADHDALMAQLDQLHALQAEVQAEIAAAGIVHDEL